MSSHTWHLVALAALATMVALASPAGAQQWKIYTLGKSEPIVADFYLEDAPWLLYRDDPSMYLFAIGCDRVARVERDGVALPPPACPVERLPTTMPRVYVALMDLEGKRLDDSIAKLREQTRAYAEAVVGSLTVARGRELAGVAGGEAAVQRSLGGVDFLASQINDTLVDIKLIDDRVQKLIEAAKSFPPSEKQRFFFATR